MARIVPLPTGLSDLDRKWIDLRVHWINQELGKNIIQQARIARPDNPAFQSDFGSAEDEKPLAARAPKGISAKDWKEEQVLLVESVAEEVAEHLNVRNRDYALQIDRGTEALNSAAGSETLVEVQLASTPTPLSLVSLLACEMGQQRLARAVSSDEAEADMPLLAELLACVSGLGICMVNATHSESYLSEEVRLEKHSCYLTMPMLAYALAVFARLREEDEPPKWERLLRGDVRSAFSQSQAFLAEHGMHEKPARFSSSFFNSYAKQLLGASSDVAHYGYRDDPRGEPLEDSELAGEDGEDEYEDEGYEEAEYEADGEEVEEYEEELPAVAHVEDEQFEEDFEEEADTRRGTVIAPSRRARRRANAGCAYCGEPTFGEDSVCLECQDSIRQNAPDITEEIDYPDTARWMLQFVLLVIAVAVVLFVVNNLRGE